MVRYILTTTIWAIWGIALFAQTEYETVTISDESGKVAVDLRIKEPIQNPVVKWKQPASSNEVTGNANYEIKLCVTSLPDVKMVEIFLNGKSIRKKNYNTRPDFSRGSDCQFTYNTRIDLKMGDNKLYAVVRDAKGETTTKVQTIVLSITDVVYHALIIGVADYIYSGNGGPSDLKEPVKDAIKVRNVLINNYTFKPENTQLLENPTHDQILDALDELKTKVKDDQNLLIFYAGHGLWECIEKDHQGECSKGNGYWLPADAVKGKTRDYIPNSTIQMYLNSIQAKHILLVSDACFSGSLFKTRNAFDRADIAIQKLVEKKSRLGMTSGNLTEVPDKSEFTKYLVQNLEYNTQEYLPVMNLFNSFRLTVMGNSDTEPQYGTVHNTGHNGGEFVFIRK